jgi:nitrite reductase/ring-hydroxylating ferredoxin subunit
MIFLCPLDAIPDRQARGFCIGEANLFALKYEGAIYAYRNSCPHLGIELNWREDEFFDRDETLLQCATHGALFLPDSGECIAGPCRGQHLQTLPVRIEKGAIYVQL